MGTSGGISGATLRVVRPGTMPDDAVATYLIQAYSDAEGTTKVGGSASPPGRAIAVHRRRGTHSQCLLQCLCTPAIGRR